MKRIFKSFMTALTLATFMGAFAVVHAGQELETLGARERLVDQEGVDILYSIDNYYTFIVGRLKERNQDEFTAVSRDAVNNSMLIKHAASQPLVYKSKVVPAYDELGIPENGAKTFATAVGEGASKAGFRAYTGADVYQHITALCRKLGGEPVFLIPKRHGVFLRLTEVSALEAFTFVADPEEDGAWEFACNGSTRLAVSKDYNYKHEAGETFSFHANRGLDGVSYMKDGQAPDAWFAGEVDDAVMEGIIAEAAIEAAGMGMDFVKVKGGMRLEANYGAGTLEGCRVITVKTMPVNGVRMGVKGKRQVMVSQFKVCQPGRPS